MIDPKAEKMATEKANVQTMGAEGVEKKVDATDPTATKADVKNVTEQKEPDKS